MKTVLTLLVALILTQSYSQSNYDKGMQQAFTLWENGDIDAAANLFERIAVAEPQKWIPSFYAGQLLVLKSFNTTDISVLKSNLDKAMQFINDAKANQRNHPEILVLEAQWFTAWIVYDGAKYGMLYAGKVAALYEKALQIAPTNPRVVLGKAEWEMGSAKFFGKSIAPYCNDIAKAIRLFDTYTTEEKYAPSGGKGHALELQKEVCTE